MSGATIAPSLPALAAHFADVPNAGLLVRLVLTMPALAIALCAPFAGVVADRIGRRRLLLSANVLFAVAGASGAVLNTLGAILVSRALLGVAVAAITTATMALAADYFSGAARDRFLGQQAAFAGLGGLVFLTAGGLAADLHWRAPFLIYLVSFALLPAIATTIRDVPHGGHAAAVEPHDGIERAGLAITLVLATAVLAMAAFYFLPTQLPFHLQDLGIHEAARAGLAIGFASSSSAVFSLAHGRMRAHLSRPALFALGFAFVGTAYLMLAAARGYGTVMLAMPVVGAGMGTLWPNLMSSAMAAAPPAFRGRVAGALTASIFLGQFVSPLLSQPIVATAGVAAAFRACAAVMVLASLAALLLAWANARRASTHLA
jgi:MFS family permease